MNWATWLAAMVPGLVARVLASLGLGLVTITGLHATTDALLGYLQSAIGGLPSDVLGLINLAGFGTAANIILGALAARIAFYTLSKAALVVGVQ